MKIGFSAFIVTALALMAACVWLWLATIINTSGPLDKDTLVYIPPGTSGIDIAKTLQVSGMITDTWPFRVASKMRADGGTLKAGEYEIPAHASMADIISILQQGKTYQRQLTIAEGLTSSEIASLVQSAPGLTGEISDTLPEGSLLPDTYSYSFNDNRADVIARMQAAMQKTLAQLWETRAGDLPIQTPEEAVILASIVEKETGIATERARVAGVFINRLRLGMPLQSDPTVIYAITQGKEKLGRTLYRNDLNIDSPYNTYKVAGLTPTPIANPGKESIAAVLQPEAHDFLYFVADGTGGHVFASDLSGHNRNVAEWRKIRKGTP